ncbi:uncharacterized protein LOC144167511 [Haemaphysalis longicornis]
MKAILLLLLLVVSTNAFSSDDKMTLIQKAGKVVESLGKILKNEASSITAEDRENALEAVKALTAFEAGTATGSEEYFFGDFLKTIIVEAVSAGVSEGVSVGIDAAIKKG